MIRYVCSAVCARARSGLGWMWTAGCECGRARGDPKWFWFFFPIVGWLVGGWVCKLWLSESGESGEGGDGLRDVWIHSRS